MLLVLFASAAIAYETAAVDCCHVAETSVRSATPMEIVIVPPADTRERVSAATGTDADHESRRAGTVRGGYGNPFRLGTPDPVADSVAEALADQLRAIGHDVRIEVGSQPAPGRPALDAAVLAAMPERLSAGVVLHGTLREWEVDFGVYGKYKTIAELELIAVGPEVPGGVWTTTLRVNEQSGDFAFAFTRGLAGLSDRAKAWYGKKSAKYVNTAGYESGLIELSSRLVEAQSEGHLLFVAGGAPAASAPTGGCTNDMQCKGDRICVQGACVAP